MGDSATSSGTGASTGVGPDGATQTQSAPGTSGGSATSSAPASGPSPAGSGSWSARTPDNLVDYYMETHWDRSAYDSKVAEFGIQPEQVGTELDKWLPAQTPPNVRSALNVGMAVATGVMDAAVLGALKSLPAIGIVVQLGVGIRDGWKAANEYGEIGDGWGMAFQILRTIADTVGGIAGNVSDTCALIQDAAAISIVGAPVAAAAATIGEIANGVQVPCDAIKAGLEIGRAHV